MHKCALHNVQRPALHTVHAELNAWGGIIVHFSGVPAGVSYHARKPFPNDLHDVVVNGGGQDGLSCSTVRPGDLFEGSWRNSWGCIGVIVRGRTPWSLVDVEPHDCGSWVPQGGTERQCLRCDHDLPIEAVRDSLQGRPAQNSNEWVMRDFDVLGLLIQPPFSVRELGTTAQQVEILHAASGLPVYTLDGVGLYQRDSALQPTTIRVPTSSLYP